MSKFGFVSSKFLLVLIRRTGPSNPTTRVYRTLTNSAKVKVEKVKEEKAPSAGTAMNQVMFTGSAPTRAKVKEKEATPRAKVKDLIKAKLDLMIEFKLEIDVEIELDLGIRI